MISYEPLFDKLVKKGMKIEDLAEKMGVQSGVLKHTLLSGKYISFDTLDKVCGILKCKVEEVIKYVPGEHVITKLQRYYEVDWEALEKKLPVELGVAGIESGHSYYYYKAMKRRGKARKGPIKKLCDKYGIDINTVTK